MSRLIASLDLARAVSSRLRCAVAGSAVRCWASRLVISAPGPGGGGGGRGRGGPTRGGGGGGGGVLGGARGGGARGGAGVGGAGGGGGGGRAGCVLWVPPPRGGEPRSP